MIPPGTYDLTLVGNNEDISDTGDLDITTDTTVLGAGARTTIVRDQNGDRIFDVLGTSTVTISGLTMRDGGGTSPLNGGVEQGGGIQMSAASTVSLVDVSVLDNAAVVDASGISAAGGGIYGNGLLTLNRVTVKGNVADATGGTGQGQGGGVYFSGTTGTMVNTTIVGNIAKPGAQAAQGGGLYVNSPMNVKYMTVSGNQALPGGGQGGGVFNNDTLTLQNSIMAGNLNGIGPDDCSDVGTIVSMGGNFVQGPDCFLGGSGDLIGVNPLLNPLADNGGQVDTMSLQDGSPALDHNADCAGIPDDAAGTARPQGSACESGAFERPVPQPPQQQQSQQSPIVDTTPTATPTPAATVPQPVLARSINATPVSGTVLVKVAGQATFVPLSEARQIPVGSIVDARKGRVRITVAGKTPGTFYSADFYQGTFQVTQLSSSLTVVKLVGGSFKACGRAAARAAKKQPGGSKEVRHLWAEGSGPFRTQGKYASAAIRGTTWLTDDRCDGTLVRVKAGRVLVRDLVARRNIPLRKGQSYLARAQRAKKG
ncbi:MAG TPA: choice-of-anchor Q domain-containing protein [Thermoleophilaceae bacterium]